MKHAKLILLLIFVSQSIHAQKMTTRVYKQILGQDLSLDIYEPEKSVAHGKAPVIILFHGGGLVGGERSSLKYQCAFFAQQGLVVVSPSYRLVPKGTKDVAAQVQLCIKDVKSAIRWVKQHGSELGVDTNRVFLGGGSAGGFLATEAALIDSINESSDDLKISTKAKALILYNPAYIPETRYTPPSVNYISRSAPPSVLFFGSVDTYKPGGDNFYNQLAKLSVPAELWVAKGEKHAFYNKNGWNEATTRKAYNFLIKLKLLSGTAQPDTEYILDLQSPN